MLRRRRWRCRRGKLLLRGRGKRRVEWLLRRRRRASVVLLRSCRATRRWWLGGSSGHMRRRSLGVGGRRCSRVSGTDGRLGAGRWSISGPRRGRRSRGDLHPSHLVGDLLHCGWRPVVLGIGRGVRPRHVHISWVVWLRHSRPGRCLCHRWGTILHVSLTVTVLIVLLRC